jgi:hypothetical protein
LILGINVLNRKCYAGIVIASFTLAVGEWTAMAWLAPAQASSQSVQAESSTGHVNISVNKQPLIQAKIAKDMVIQSWADEDTGMVWVGNVYVNTSRASGYDVTAIGGGKQGAFELTGGDTHVPLRVAWNDLRTAQSLARAVPLTPGVPTTIAPGRQIDRSGKLCRRGLLCNQAQLIVRIPKVASSSLKLTNLSQSLTIVIAMN